MQESQQTTYLEYPNTSAIYQKTEAKSYKKKTLPGTFEITERRTNVRYDIRIVAVDNAGNQSQNPCTGYVRTIGELKTPNISVTPQTVGQTMTGGYYKCGVKIHVTDSASPSTTTAKTLHYEVVDSNNESLQKASGEVTNYINFSQEGTFKVRAWAKDEDRKPKPQNRMANIWNRHSSTNNTNHFFSRNNWNKQLVQKQHNSHNNPTETISHQE